MLRGRGRKLELRLLAGVIVSLVEVGGGDSGNVTYDSNESALTSGEHGWMWMDENIFSMPVFIGCYSVFIRVHKQPAERLLH